MWKSQVRAGRVALCTPVALEILYSARSRAEYRVLADELRSLPMLELNAATERIALDVQAALAERSQHRGATPVDIVVAAIAAVHGVVLLHYDRHFDTVERATGQPTRWLAPRGRL